MNPFQEKHLFLLLELWEKTEVPLDLFVRKYFLNRKFLGARDRRVISEAVYKLIRNKLLLEELLPHSSWEEKKTLLAKGIETNPLYATLAPYKKQSFPLFFWEKLVQEYGEENAFTLCTILNEKAYPTVRINPIKTTREFLFEKWKETFPIWKGKESPFSLFFEKNAPLTSLTEYKEGLFEIQDESSQKASLLVSPKEGESLLDFCAGSGGKSLAIAPFMKSPHLFLYDIRKNSLEEAKKRLTRAGVTSFQIFSTEESLLPFLGKIDIVLVDVPCSGSGSLRRNPDRKYTITKELLSSLKETQRAIFIKAFSYLKKGGKIFYMTCSILQEENEEQANFFLSQLPLKLRAPFQKTLPKRKEGDGFFVASFEKL